jgi:hypothetical protein
MLERNSYWRPEPLGEVLMKLLPEGFSTLLAPAAALPALLLVLVPEEPAVTRQGEALESQFLSRLAEPPLASTAVPPSASAVANPIAANFIVVRLWCCRLLLSCCRQRKAEKRLPGWAFSPISSQFFQFG